MRQAAFLNFGRVKFVTSKDDIQEADGEKSRGPGGLDEQELQMLHSTGYCVPAMGRQHSRHSGYSRDLEKDSPSPQEFTRACRPGGHDKERRLERLRGQHFSLLVPEGCVGSRGARRSAVTTACWAQSPSWGGNSPQLLRQKEAADARFALDLHSIQSAGIHYRLSLTHCPPLGKRLNCTVSANTS